MGAHQIIMRNGARAAGERSESERAGKRSAAGSSKNTRFAPASDEYGCAAAFVADAAKALCSRTTEWHATKKSNATRKAPGLINIWALGSQWQKASRLAPFACLCRGGQRMGAMLLKYLALVPTMRESNIRWTLHVPLESWHEPTGDLNRGMLSARTSRIPFLYLLCKRQEVDFWEQRSL